MWAYDSFSTRYNGVDSGKWDFTATDGSVPITGDALTLTYSFVPDGTLLLNGGSGFGEPNVGSDLFADFDAHYGSTATWKAFFTSVFDTWSTLTGITYIEVSDDGAAFPSSSGLLGSRGDIRIGGHFIDGSGNGVLAYNYFPNTGDMVLDTDNAGDFFAIATNSYRLLRNTISHEHGHGLGFSHVCPLDGTKVMEPNITTAFDHSALDDIAHANRKYGDPNEKSGGNDTDGTATAVGAVFEGFTSIGDGIVSPLSIDGVSDQDYFSFTIAQGASAEITLSPVGSSSTQWDDLGSCVGGPGAVVDFPSIINLDIEILSTDGSTVLATGASANAGSDEITSYVLPAAGTYFLRVYTDDSAAFPDDDQVQMYDMVLSIISVNPLEIFVDFTEVSNGFGTSLSPFNNLADAISSAADGAEIKIAPGSSSETFTGGSTISIEVDLLNTDGGSGTVSIGTSIPERPTSTPGSGTLESGFVTRKPDDS